MGVGLPPICVCVYLMTSVSSDFITDIEHNSAFRGYSSMMESDSSII